MSTRFDQLHEVLQLTKTFKFCRFAFAEFTGLASLQQLARPLLSQW